MEDDKGHQALDARLIGRIWAYLFPHRKAVFVCLAVSLAATGMRILQPIIIHRVLDKDVAAGDVAGIARMSLLFFGVVVLIFILDVVFNYLTGIIGQKSMHDLRMALFRHVLGLDVAFFDRMPVGRLLTRMTSDISSLSDLFTEGVVSIFAEMAMIAGVLGLMFFYSPRLTLVVLCATPFMALTMTLFRRHSQRWYLEVRARLAQMNAYLQENVAGMRTVQSFNREARNYAAFYGFNDEYRLSQVQTILGFALFFPAINVISNLTLAAVIWVGGRRIIEQGILSGASLSFATLFLFVQSVNMLFTPLRNLSEKYNLLQSAMASSARIFRLLDTKAKIVKPADEIIPGPLRDRVAFENVGFEYVPGEAVLREVSFEIKRGQTVAIVGATGSGKTTLINLLTRFYDATEGRITLDGVDLRRFDPAKLRRLFAVVLQEVFLFSGTIAENIRLTNPDLTDEQIWDLLAQVRADDFVRALPGGVNAPVHERGGTFSTGQKQLLAFARALAADPQILVLDEATANVDTETEQRIQEAIARLLEGRTALVIAHRLSTIQKADLIVVMHKGRIRESGTHDQLIAQDGLYRRLYELQYRSEAIAEPVV